MKLKKKEGKVDKKDSMVDVYIDESSISKD